MAFAAMLAACAAPPRIETEPPPPAVADVPFAVAGRLSARHGDEGVAGSFRWSHAPPSDEILLSTPFGQALARLAGGPDGVELEFADGRVARAPDWESLTRQALGVPVPVRGLAWWVRGLPHAGASHAIERDPAGRTAVLRQDGWEVVYGYRDDGPRPSRLVLSFPGVEVRLAIDEGPDARAP